MIMRLLADGHWFESNQARHTPSVKRRGGMEYHPKIFGRKKAQENAKKWRWELSRKWNGFIQSRPLSGRILVDRKSR